MADKVADLAGPGCFFANGIKFAMQRQDQVGLGKGDGYPVDQRLVHIRAIDMGANAQAQLL